MKVYKPSSSDTQKLYMVQEYENQINEQIKNFRFTKIGLYVSLGVAVVMTLFYFHNELWPFSLVPLTFFTFFYFVMKKDSNEDFLRRQIDSILKGVECHHKIENGKVYVIQEDGKRIEINQF